MKTFVKYLIAIFLRIALWFRYKVTVKGLEKLTPGTLSKPGGTLFLPNHPAVFVDPTLITLALWPKFPIRPMIVEYQFYMPVINKLMRFLDALPVPNFSSSTNSLKRKKTENVIQTVIHDLKGGQNFLIYPAGKLKLTGYEAIGGASGVHRIISEAPEANVVLVRTRGLWGSTFSRAITGQVPLMFPTIFQGMKHVFKNLLFFTPRRHIEIEFEPAPADFPFGASRLELNKYLELYYNRPDHLTQQQGQYPGDSLVLVSMSSWGNVYPEIIKKESGSGEQYHLASIPPDIQQKVIKKIAELTQYDPATIKPEMQLAVDLGMDSLDISEVAVFLQDNFDVSTVPYVELSSVGKVMAIAAKKIKFKEEAEEEEADASKWKKQQGPRERIKLAQGNTIPEVFLNNCDRMKKEIACADMRTGVMTYHELKLRALLVADYLRSQPGDYIGILLPSSVGASLLILATLLAGKVPMLINWTVGPRHLDSVVKLSKVQVILTAWSFIDKLENIDFSPIEDKLVMLEDLKPKFTIKKKLKAFWQSRKKASTLLKDLQLNEVKKEDTAILLFTSGTESLPKGVPLSHHNILSNQRSALEGLQIYSDDVLLGMLPPFHAFGFTIASILPLLSGLRVAYSPDPTDGKRLAKACEKWGITLICGTPTFIKGIIKAALPGQLKNMRLCFTGAEKAPPELFKLMEQFDNVDFLEGYGITECSPVITFNRQGQPHKGVGIAVPGEELLIIHPETHEILPENTQGLILARGPNVFGGYLNPGLSSPFLEVQGKTWYKTGDLGNLDEKGYLTISGRLKRFIKIGAEMVSLSAIEDGLLQMGLKKGWQINLEGASLAVSTKEIENEKPRIYLFTVFNVDLEDVNKALKEAGFSNLIKISQVMQLTEIPIMGTGKINYRLLESDFVPKLEVSRIGG